MKVKLGILAGITAACILGGAGVLTKILMNMGVPALMVIVLSHVCAAPMLALMMLWKKTSFKVSKREFGELLFVSLIGMGLANMTMFTAFDYLAVGQAAVIHSMYPTVILLLELIIFRTKISKAKWVAVSMCIAGVLCLSPLSGVAFSDGMVIGFTMAALSALFYAMYFVAVDHSSLKHMDTFKISLYTCILTIFQPLGYCMYDGVASFDYSLKIWLLLAVFGLLASVIATICLQVAIRYCGAVTSGIASILEPIAACVAGVIFLQESFTLTTGVGCVLVMSAVLVIVLNSGKAEETEKPVLE